MKILVIGSTNVDLVTKVKQMPLVGESVICSSFDKFPGGKGANQAYASGKLGGDITFLSAVGDDDHGKMVTDSLKAVGVNTAYLKIQRDCPTGMAFISVNEQGDNSIVAVPGANNFCNVAYLSSHYAQIEQSDILLTQLEIPAQASKYALQEAKRLGRLTILNPAPAPDQDIPREALKGLNYITPNESEAGKLTGIPTDSLDGCMSAAKKLLSWGVKNVIVTLGEQGALLANAQAMRVFPTYRLTPVDTTAAGDTFNAALAVQLAEGEAIENAMVFANAAATLAVTKKGAQTSIPARSEVAAFVKEHAAAFGLD